MTSESPDRESPAASADNDQPTSQPSAQNEAPSSAEGDKSSSALAEAQAEAARTRDQLLRTAADFDNYRKRSRREIEDADRQGRIELLRELLPVFDNLERAATHATQATDAKAVADGVEMVLRQFLDAIGRAGIKRIEALGASFDPSRHEAVQQLETDDKPAGSVVAEVQPGYMLGDKLIRAALVVVAKPRQKKPEASPN